MKAELILPYPPSLWRLYRGQGRKRQRTPLYDDWLRRASLHHAFAPMIDGPVEIAITATPTEDHRRRDLDNLAKPILDWATSLKIIQDDSDVRRLSLEWGDVDLSRLKVPADRGVRVEIETCGP